MVEQEFSRERGALRIARETKDSSRDRAMHLNSYAVTCWLYDLTLPVLQLPYLQNRENSHFTRGCCEDEMTKYLENT